MHCFRFLSQTTLFLILSITVLFNIGLSVAQERTNESKQGQVDPPTLDAKLESSDPELQLEAIAEIGLMRASGAKYLDRLIPLLASPHVEVADQAALAIGAMGPIAMRGAPALIAQMKQPAETPGERQALWMSSSRALLGLGPKVIPILVEALDSADRTQFTGICGALYEFGTAAKPALDALIERADRDPDSRWTAMYVMEAIGRPSFKAMPLLLKSLSDANFQNQVIACRVLAAIGPDAKEAKPILYGLTESGNTSVKGRAAIALGAIGFSDGDDAKLLETLVILMDSPQQMIKERAVIGLGHLGSDASSVTERVREAMRSSKFSGKCQAAVALWKISGSAEESVTRLIELMDKVDYDLTAIESLGEIGPEAVEALPALFKKMESEDPSYALEGCRAIAKMGPAARDAIPVVTKLLDSVDPEVRILAKKALDEIERPEK